MDSYILEMWPRVLPLPLYENITPGPLSQKKTQVITHHSVESVHLFPVVLQLRSSLSHVREAL
jgi:hypothetical protein